MTVTLKPELDELIEKQMESGAYAGPEELIERALEVYADGEYWLYQNRDWIGKELEARISNPGRSYSPEEVKTLMAKRKEDFLRISRPE